MGVFEKLNARQREAACLDERPLLVIAGAGTGKTNTLAHRVAHLILQGAAAERILLLTFTRRAALEMTRRAQRIVAAAMEEKAGGKGSAAPAVRLPWSGTFHSVANRLIRRNASRVGLEESFSVLDRGDAADLMDVVRHELGFSKAEKRFPRKDTCLAIYSHKVNTQGPLCDTLYKIGDRLQNQEEAKFGARPQGRYRPQGVNDCATTALNVREKNRSGSFYPKSEIMA